MTTTKTMAFAGKVSIAGAVSMLIGAAFWGASGTDLWQALANDQMASYLSQLPEVKSLLVTNTCFWVLGVLLMASAGSLMSGFSTANFGWAQMAKVFMQSGATLGIVSFICMLVLAIHPSNIELATLTGWIGTRLDDIATTLIVGFGPFCLALAGRESWIPGWLAVWAYLAGITGALVVISMLTGIVFLGFIIIPFGIGWMIAAGIVLIKKSNTSFEI